MSDECKKVDSLVTPYIDGELDAGARDSVAAHLNRCPPCHARVDVERAVRDLVHERRDTLRAQPAPQALRARCAALERSRAEIPEPLVTRTWRSSATPYALAASLFLIVGGAFTYQMTARSAAVMAAELTADHVKCFALNSVLNTECNPRIIEASLATRFNWPARLPEHPERIGLQLVGERTCVYGEGRVAHIMYRRNGQPVSVFMLPNTTRPSGLVKVMGHEAAVWSDSGRTFVLIASEPREEVVRLASFVQSSLQ